MLYGPEYLKKVLESKQPRIKARYNFYDMKAAIPDFGIATPPHLRDWKTSLGWCAKAVDSLADRLNFDRFKNDNLNFTDIYNMNNPDILIDSAIKGALISACSFIYIYQDDDGEVHLQALDGSRATGFVDPITGMLTEGYAILSTDKDGHVLREAYFVPHKTVIRDLEDKSIREITNNVDYPLLVPVPYRPDATRPLGHSRISRACMDITKSAIRTIKRSEISAEFYSFPQRYILGLAEDVEIDKWKSALDTIVTISKDEDGDVPTVGQFSQQSMEPHINQLRMFAAAFAGETGLTLDDLGFVTDNPSSAESIKASHEGLRLTARKAQRNFSTAFINAGLVAASLRDGMTYTRNVAYETKAQWAPVFEPDYAALSLIGDAVIKLNTAIPNSISKEELYELVGIGG